MRFLADVMLARPGRWLRMFGYDTVIAKESQTDDELITLAKEQDRIILTRDKTLAAKTEGSKAVKTIYIEERTPDKQLEEIVHSLKLEISFPENTRCSQCNGELEVTTKEKVKDLVPEKVQSDDFWQCKSCGKVYWKGSHWDRIQNVIKKLDSK